MTSNAAAIELGKSRFIANYRQAPVVFTRGQGVWLEDVEGRAYLDMTAGIAVCALGHAHPAWAEAIARQAARLGHVSNLYWNEPQILLADKLVRIAFPGRVFFCNSGAEANEAALKLARRLAGLRGMPDREHILSTRGSFHGRSVATVSVTGQEKYRQGFGPLFGPVEFAPYGELEAAASLLRAGRFAAMIVEPIQAEGGIVVPPAGYLAGLRALCDETQTTLIFDEVQTGLGRTGRWFGHQHEGVVPDVMTLAKGLAGGVPIGAIVATEAASQGLASIPGQAVTHASTFGGNPLACAAGLAVIDTIERENLLMTCSERGAYLDARLQGLVTAFPHLAIGTRGRGLLRGLVVKSGAADLIAAARAHGLLLSLAGDNVLRFVPALTVSKAELDEACNRLAAVLAATPAAA